jgi:hypothetical protein
MTYDQTVITAVNQTTNVTPFVSQGTSCIQLTNVGSNIFVSEISQDSVNYIKVGLVDKNGLPVSQITADGIYYMQTAGAIYFRVRCATYVSGSTTITTSVSDLTLANLINAEIVGPLDGSGNVKVSLPSGTTVGLTSGATVALASGSHVSLDSGTNNIGSVTIAAGSGSGVAPSSYAIIPAAAGTTTVKSTPGVLYGIYLNGTSLLGSVTVLDGATTVLPSSLLGSTLATAPFSIGFANGIQFTTSIKVTLAGVSTSSVTVLYR